MSLALDDPARVRETRIRIRSKPALEAWYRECYAKWLDCVDRCPAQGTLLELGSGAGFANECIPDLVTSDLLPYEGVDRVIDATQMPFGEGELRAIFMLNAFHHIANAEAFLREAQRCLAPGGRVFMVDQHVGWISRPILAAGHHEPFDPKATEWGFPSNGPLSSANGALAWIVFVRDLSRFQTTFPQLALEQYTPHSPLRYFLAGGLKPWSLLPGWLFPLATGFDRTLTRSTPQFGSFADIELVRR